MYFRVYNSHLEYSLESNDSTTTTNNRSYGGQEAGLYVGNRSSCGHEACTKASSCGHEVYFEEVASHYMGLGPPPLVVPPQ